MVVLGASSSLGEPQAGLGAGVPLDGAVLGGAVVGSAPGAPWPAVELGAGDKHAPWARGAGGRGLGWLLTAQGAHGAGGRRAWRAPLSPSTHGRQGTTLPGKDAPGMHVHSISYKLKSLFDFQIPNVHGAEVSFPFS